VGAVALVMHRRPRVAVLPDGDDLAPTGQAALARPGHESRARHPATGHDALAILPAGASRLRRGAPLAVLLPRAQLQGHRGAARLARGRRLADSRCEGDPELVETAGGLTEPVCSACR